MDKAVLRNFAIESRKDLMEKIDRKIKLFYVDEEFQKENRGDVIVLSNGKHTLTLTKEEDTNRDKLLKRIVELGYEQVVEEAAFTWFNRIVAIRYMEINDYLPLTKNNQSLGIKVLSSTTGEAIPEILKFSNLNNPELDINFKRDVYSSLNNDNEKFKYVILLVCKKLAKVIPQVFGGIIDYIDLLIPDNMLNENGIVYKITNDISIDNFQKVEIIGWLYQYYISEKKDEVFNNLKNGKKVNKEEIPSATQIFTTDWIVKYMVDNSLGKYLEEHCNVSFDNYEYKMFNDVLNKNNKSIEDVTFIDPCCGSGHILVYAIDLLYNCYLKIGYAKKDIIKNILEKNIYGLDIDERAKQLSVLSVLLKAREYDKGVFNYDLSNLNIMSYEETNDFSFNDFTNQKEYDSLKNAYTNAKNLGLLSKVASVDLTKLQKEIQEDDTIFGIDKKERILPLIKLDNILSSKYDVVVTNPPYMGANNMNKALFEYLGSNYSESKQDLYSCCMKRCIELAKEDGYIGMITMESWMSLSKFKKFRKLVLDCTDIDSMIHMPYDGQGKTSLGINFGTVTFVLKKTTEISQGQYMCIRHYDIDEDGVPFKFPTINDRYLKNTIKTYKELDDYSISYWISNRIKELFLNEKSLNDVGDAKQGLATSDNNRFLRLWFEVENDKISFNSNSKEEALKSRRKWFPITKGGQYNKWYGNNYYVVDWENDGYEMKQSVLSKYDYLDSADFVVKNQNYYFREGITWSTMTSGLPSFRYTPSGFIFETKGSMYFPYDKDNLYYILAILNSKVSNKFLEILCPTKDIHEGPLSKIPFVINQNNIDQINELVRKCINLCKKNWDSYELSWDFKRNSIISQNENVISEAILKLKEQNNKERKELKEYETILNSLISKTYDLESQLDLNITDDELSIPCFDEKKEIKKLLHYSVGCMFGRYSLNQDGLVLAGQKFNSNNYTMLKPDDDNIIPISDNADVYYNDDIVGKFKQFLEIAFGKEYINVNLEYIADVLGRKGTESNEDTIRRYFLNDFYSEHCSNYSVVGSGKRPIYWLFDSGKNNGFKCLMYLHRYDEQIVSKIRTKYLHNTISIYQRTIDEIDYKLNGDNLSVTDKRELQNKKIELNNKITECNEYEEMVGNVANKMIKLDLDDGVAINYAKFVDDNGKSILAKIK